MITKEFAAIMDALPQLVWMTDTAGKPLFINRKWIDYTGQDPTLAAAGELYHPHDSKAVEESWQAALKIGTSYEFSFRIRSKRGEYRWFLSRGSLIEGESGERDRWFGTCTDIDDQKKAIEAARESEKVRAMSEGRFRSIIDQSPFPTQLLTKTGRTIEVNRAWRTLWDISDEVVTSFILKDYNILSDPLMAGLGLRDSILLAFEGVPVNCPPVFYDPRTANRPGRARWVESFFAPILSEDSQIREIILLFNDVTERVEAEMTERKLRASEEAAVQASRLKSEFLANMSHEIRTPINGVVGMTGLLSDTSLTEQQRSYLDAIKHSSETLLTVINDILDFSRIEAGKLQFEAVDFDLHEVARSAQQTLSYVAATKNLDLRIEFSSKILRSLNGDPGRIKQILLNLMNNALKFTENGSVKVIADLVRDSDNAVVIRFEIHDTGIGIADSALSQLFNSFSQAETSTNRRYGGSGLGLAISKRLVEQMNGTIGVETRVGVGSMFWFEIELAKTKQPLNELRSYRREETPRAFSRRFRILIAEDNQINQVIAKSMIEKMNLHADVVASGLEAVDSLREIPYDLVLMDCQMPGMDGYEATKVIRQGIGILNPEIPILAMTANAMTDDIAKCLRAGMNAHIAKPVKAIVLAGILHQWLED